MLTPEKAFFSGGGFGLFKFGVPSYNVGVHFGSCSLRLSNWLAR